MSDESLKHVVGMGSSLLELAPRICSTELTSRRLLNSFTQLSVSSPSHDTCVRPPRNLLNDGLCIWILHQCACGCIARASPTKFANHCRSCAISDLPKRQVTRRFVVAENAARQLQESSQARDFGQWLNAHGLKAYTFNGFPQGDFHQPIVKHAVYEPTWLNPSRLDYSRQLANVLVELLEPGQSGSISTLPLGWPHRE